MTDTYQIPMLVSETECDGDERLIEKVVDSKVIIKLGLMSVKEDVVELSNSSISSRRYVSHPGAVVVVGAKDDSYLMIRQYRSPCSDIFWEFPAGKIDPGEDPFDAAKREFHEEAGCKAGSWRFVGFFFPCVGYSSEKMYLYYAEDLKILNQNTDEGEFINCFFVERDKIRSMLSKGMFTDSKILSSLTLLASCGLFSFS